MLNRPKFCVAAAALLLMLFQHAPAHAAPIVPNGDFETGANGAPPPSWQGNASNPIPSDSVLIKAGAGTGGSNAAEFLVAPNNTNAGIDSDLIPGFVVGQLYDLNFKFRGDTDGNTLFANLLTSDNQLDPLSNPAFSFTSAGYQDGSVLYQAATTSEYVEFFLPTDVNGADIFIDDVTISAVPEIERGSFGLPLALCAGSLLLLADRRRRST